MSEGQVVKACIEWLCLHDCDIIRLNTGSYLAEYNRRDGSRGRYRIRYGKVGAGDIIAISPHGRWIEVETKSLGGKQRPEQEQRQVEVERRKGVYILAYSSDDLERRRSDILTACW